MLNDEELQAIKAIVQEVIKEELNPVNSRLDNLETRLDKVDRKLNSLNRDVSQIKRDTAINRGALNEIIDWIDKEVRFDYPFPAPVDNS